MQDLRIDVAVLRNGHRAAALDPLPHEPPHRLPGSSGPSEYIDAGPADLPLQKIRDRPPERINAGHADDGTALLSPHGHAEDADQPR